MGPTAYTLLSGDLIFQMLRFQELMGERTARHFILRPLYHKHACFQLFKTVWKAGAYQWCIFAFLIPISGSCRAHRKDTECGIAASLLHAEVALTSALPLRSNSRRLPPTKVSSDIACHKNISRLNSSNISNKGRQSNRGDYNCSSSSSGSVAGSNLGGVAVVAGMF